MSTDAAGYPTQADRAEAEKNGCKDIREAAKFGLVGAVRHFLREDPDSVKEKHPISLELTLRVAARYGHEAVVEVLLDAGASVDAKDDVLGGTPLHFAAEHGHHAVVERLLAAGATVDLVDTEGRTPLHWAAEKGHDATLERLLAAGASVDAVDNGGMTPFQLADRKGHAMTMGWLKPVCVVTLGGKECRCNSHTIRTINDLKHEAQRKLGMEITHLIGENAEELPAIEPDITLTALYSQPSDQQ